MNNNKQQTKGNKMRKIAMIIGVLTVIATSANAGYWTHTLSVGDARTTGGISIWNSTYNYSPF